MARRLAGESIYAEEIRRVMRRRGLPAVEARHVEAYMRVEHSTLDGLSAWEFADEVAVAVACVIEGGEAAAEALAQSYGMTALEAV